ncbi:ATP-binding protein [Herbidospora daliensis]|uniref:ATP-binding protein n=1 Tax=Herbidospora daliensis TaxID=295585 RepID=UPI0007C8634A|nr:ATP-binding protein [Herbidospora daliensis]
MDGRPVFDATTLLERVPDGVAVIDERGRFVQANPAARTLCGIADLVGAESPFPAGTDDGVVGWGAGREFAYQMRELTGRERLVVFRDVTESRRHQRRLAAIASAAGRVGGDPSLRSTLDALAREVLEADALASVQIMTVNAAGARFQVMGSAGFAYAANFFDLLLDCAEAGAELRMIDAFTSRLPVVVPGRYAAVMADPAWEPLREHMRQPEWDWFASVPLLVRGEPVGILNAFYAPGQEINGTALDFLLAMADQAAMAVHYAAMLEREREVARREERQRLARDLHDSVVQHVFSMGMQAESLGMTSGRGPTVDSGYVVRVAGELGQISKAVLTDLRVMVTDLHPTPSADQGLAAALFLLAESTMGRTGLEVAVTVDDPRHDLDDLAAELREDAYRVIAEALHNSVKHSRGGRVTITVGLSGRGTRRLLVCEVADDGRGLDAAAEGEGGFGMTTMRERAARWSGRLTIGSEPGGGTSVRLELPLPASLPAEIPALRIT